jgi:hypothetical protein
VEDPNKETTKFEKIGHKNSIAGKIREGGETWMQVIIIYQHMAFDIVH